MPNKHKDSTYLVKKILTTIYSNTQQGMFAISCMYTLNVSLNRKRNRHENIPTYETENI